LLYQVQGLVRCFTRTDGGCVIVKAEQARRTMAQAARQQGALG